MYKDQTNKQTNERTNKRREQQNMHGRSFPSGEGSALLLPQFSRDWCRSPQGKNNNQCIPHWSPQSLRINWWGNIKYQQMQKICFPDRRFAEENLEMFPWVSSNFIFRFPACPMHFPCISHGFFQISPLIHWDFSRLPVSESYKRFARPTERRLSTSDVRGDLTSVNWRYRWRFDLQQPPFERLKSRPADFTKRYPGDWNSPWYPENVW